MLNTAVFRVDASLAIGTGHVMRCLTLARALVEEGCRCHFVMGKHQGNLAEFVAANGMAVHLLDIPPGLKSPESMPLAGEKYSWLGKSWEEDAEQTSDILKHLRPDWLVVDHYALDERWESRVATYVGQILAIDDMADRKHACDVLIDQNLGTTPLDYAALVPAHCKLLIGPEYAILRPRFEQLRKQSLNRRRASASNRILICMGGVDADNFTGIVLNALASSRIPVPRIELDIVMGIASPWIDIVRSQVERLPYKTAFGIGVKDMAERMCQADLCIGAAGSMSWERCCLGLPSLIFVLADNQRKIAQALADSGAATILELPPASTVLGESLTHILQDRRSVAEMSEQAARITDGKGCKRILAQLPQETRCENHVVL